MSSAVKVVEDGSSVSSLGLSAAGFSPVAGLVRKQTATAATATTATTLSQRADFLYLSTDFTRSFTLPSPKASGQAPTRCPGALQARRASE